MNKIHEELESIKSIVLNQCKRADSKKNVEIVYEVCTEITKGSRNFSYANVGDLSQAKGGVNAQVIRNKNDSGTRFRMIVDAFEKAFKPQVQSVIRGEYDWIDNIEDYQDKFLAKQLMQEKQRLQRENNQLRERLTKGFNAPVIPETKPQKVPNNRTMPLLEEKHFDWARELRNALSNGNLNQYGLIIDKERGYVYVEGTHKVVLPRGTLQLINKILEIDNE